MATLGTYYYNGSSFASATAIYTNSALTILAPDGYYSDAGIVRQQLSGVLLNASACVSCATPCGSGVSATSSSQNGRFSAAVDLANDTGAVVIYGYYGSTIPDGQRMIYNGTTYNRFTCNGNHDTITLVDGAGTQVDYAGINNASGAFTYIGRTNADLIANSPYTGSPNSCPTEGGQLENYVLQNNVYTAQGTYVTSTILNDMVGTANNTNLTYTAVIPKTSAVPTAITIENDAPLCGTLFTWDAACPSTTALKQFNSSNSQLNTTCTSNKPNIFYFAQNAVHSGGSFTSVGNTEPFIGNFVFKDVNGSQYLNDTNTAAYYIIDGNKYIQVRNGVVIAKGNCT